MEQIGDDIDAAFLDGGGGRILVLVDHVLVERLGHELFGLWIHPGGDERGQIQSRAAVEHQFVVDVAVGGVGIELILGKSECGYRIGGEPAGVGRRDDTVGMDFPGHRLLP